MTTTEVKISADGIPVALTTLALKKILRPAMRAPKMLFQGMSKLAGEALAAAPTKIVLYFDRGINEMPADTWPVASMTIFSPRAKGVGVKAMERAIGI